MHLVLFAKVPYYQHKQDIFGWICINDYPYVFLRRWGGCLTIPQHRWGPLWPHSTTEFINILSMIIAVGQKTGRNVLSFVSKPKTCGLLNSLAYTSVFGNFRELTGEIKDIMGEM